MHTVIVLAAKNRRVKQHNRSAHRIIYPSCQVSPEAPKHILLRTCRHMRVRIRASFRSRTDKRGCRPNRRRTQAQSAQRYQEGRNDVISALFPVGDNLERALASCTDENTRQGVDMILKSFKKQVKKSQLMSLQNKVKNLLNEKVLYALL